MEGRKEFYKQALVKIIREKTGAEPKFDKIRNTVERWLEKMHRDQKDPEGWVQIGEEVPIEFLAPVKDRGPEPCRVWAVDHLRRAEESRQPTEANTLQQRSQWVGYHVAGFGESPIDIQTRRAKLYHLPPLEFLDLFRDGQTRIWNDGRTMKVASTWPAYMTDGPIFCEYKFDHLHFHWSQDSTSGTEHAFDGKRYALEGHFVFKVHSCQDYQKQIRVKKYNTAVIGIMFYESTNAPYYQTFSYCPNVEKHGQEIMLSGNVLKDFQSALTGGYFNYSGSLTTPPYTENVNWTVMKRMLPIKRCQLDAIRRLQSKNGPINDLVRELQPLGDREVLSSVDNRGDLDRLTCQI